MSETPFTIEQQEYLKGLFAGIQQNPSFFVGKTAGGSFTHVPGEAATPNLADTRVHGFDLDELCKEERIKHEEHGLDIWDKLLDHAAKDRFPEGGDVFRWKFYGLFYVKPAQDSLMLRCRIPGCALRADQIEGLADIAATWGGNYAHITTRGNIQIREIAARDSVDVLLALRDIGLTSRGSGADNIRNVTASPTSGFDPHELIDVLPLAKAMHHYILNNREMYDLPRKFNISFDSGGSISVCADTNDIAFQAVRVSDSSVADPGIYFRVQLCGITGHKQFAMDTGLMLRPDQCVAYAAAILQVFRRNGDRTNRKKARLKYLVDDWGLEKFLAEVNASCAFTPLEVPLDRCDSRRPVPKLGYIGVHPARTPGHSYVGVAVPVGRLEPEQMRGIADISRRHGSGDVRLTVWQNLLIPNIREASTTDVIEELRTLGLSTEYHPIVNGMVACTGSRGCKYSSTDTKGHALELGDYLRDRVVLDQPVNIHFTGCPHSCAQHYIGDIGLIGVKVKIGDESVEGYNIVLGGGTDDQQFIAQEVFTQVPFSSVPSLVEMLLNTYMNERKKGESFAAYTRRQSPADLREKFHQSA